MDEVLQSFWGMLERLDMLDDTLLVLTGDHGPRIGADADFHPFGTQHQDNYAVPALISTPSTRRLAKQSPPAQLQTPSNEMFQTLDVLPTLLDAMDFPVDIIAAYPGQSMLRSLNQRFAFASQMPGGVYAQIDDGAKKAVRQYYDSPNYCGYHRERDPTETLGYCTASGWIERTNADGSTTSSESLFATENERQAFIDWVNWAGHMNTRHVDLSYAFW